MIRRRAKWGPIKYKAGQHREGREQLLALANQNNVKVESFSEDGRNYYGMWYRERIN